MVYKLSVNKNLEFLYKEKPKLNLKLIKKELISFMNNYKEKHLIINLDIPDEMNKIKTIYTFKVEKLKDRNYHIMFKYYNKDYTLFFETITDYNNFIDHEKTILSEPYIIKYDTFSNNMNDYRNEFESYFNKAHKLLNLFTEIFFNEKMENVYYMFKGNYFHKIYIDDSLISTYKFYDNITNEMDFGDLISIKAFEEHKELNDIKDYIKKLD